MFAKLVIAALAALTVQNLLFVGGIGFSRALRAALRPMRTIIVFSLFVTFFSLFSAFSGLWLKMLFRGSASWVYLRPALVAGSDALLYLLAAWLTHRFLPKWFETIGSVLAQSAVSTLMLALPFVCWNSGYGFAQAAGFAFGTGAAFFLAAAVLHYAAPACKNPDAPKAFSGLPNTLIYVGILSMAFAGLAGTRIF